MKAKKEITIYDIAKKLKYSPSTISRALNDHTSISKKTIRAIKKTAKEMGYHPNSLAASLRNNRSKTLGIMISRINRPFISSLISGIEEHARKSGYNVIISQSNDKYENEVVNAQTLYNSRISGLIVSLSMETRKVDHLKQFMDQGIPIVFVDRVPDELNIHKVIIDNYAAGYKATQHLIEQGCSRIAHFAGAQHRNVYRERKKGYIDALKDYNIPVDNDLIIRFKSLSFEEGEKATRKLLDLPGPPDGIFSANDTTAVSAILHAKKRGVKIPEELAVIGFNDDPIASIVEPGLSTITHPAIKMGQICAQRILQHAREDQDHAVSEITVLPTELLIRDSSNRKGI
ncbi:LacI family DNA-binding transcriptional regulator [Sinomicrobium weinanense]|uniref:LacI family DNA-binding transcriptional regulator n=1 Tax=Sinomicrobium weinanense TaxID=2842200 RepID=A0A926JUC4_9FLAO|nr:LacI family DNA-binding transcriptional regulator [Sinomicrobium weinanense]MBC9797403.1 LacI family DNA-binding transcriptional regulator [Sinomicrobium weinanense]MBU3124558.1 LacI family transcriptional regulator [Sinomicrobium weinanense]